MFKSFGKLKETIEKLTHSESKNLSKIQEKCQKYIHNKKYEEGINYVKTTLEKMRTIESQSLQNCVKHEIVKIYNHYILYLLNNNPNQNIKQYFIECDKYIGNNIYSYLLKQNNYCCYLVQNNHVKQAKSLLNKLLIIDLVNYLSEKTEKLDQIQKNYSNLSSIENNLKSYQEALNYGMESLALGQFNQIFNGEKDNHLYLGYYNIGVQQEFLKRNNDSKSSFYQSRCALEKSDETNKQYGFIKEIKIDKEDRDIINFKDSLENCELVLFKHKRYNSLLKKKTYSARTERESNKSSISQRTGY